MAENISSGINDGEEDNPMTLDDFIEEESKLVKDAIAVLGSSDDKNCTYNLGYVKRQALYACITCTPQTEPTSQPAGICLACSYHCHEGHDLIELYTKRLFRCDCGNSKFADKKCNLEPVKDLSRAPLSSSEPAKYNQNNNKKHNKAEVNDQNGYNQNFKGLYCTCARPYPDPDDATPDEMIQCSICEDWYHTRHLHSALEDGSLSNNFAEMICGSCTTKLAFLQFYTGLAVSPISKTESSETSVTEVNVDQSLSDNTPESNGTSQEKAKTDENEVEKKVNGDVIGVKNSDVETNEDESVLVNGSSSSSLTLPQESEESCLIKKMKPLSDNSSGTNATFWPSSFRSSLCSCTSCKKMYLDLNISWILEDSDTVQAYEEKGLQEVENTVCAHPEGLLNNELAKFNRFQQVELIQNYNDFKSSLSEFLGKFAQEKKVVKKEDVEGFFEDMQARKRQKVGTLQYNCH